MRTRTGQLCPDSTSGLRARPANLYFDPSRSYRLQSKPANAAAAAADSVIGCAPSRLTPRPPLRRLRTPQIGLPGRLRRQPMQHMLYSTPEARGLDAPAPPARATRRQRRECPATIIPAEPLAERRNLPCRSNGSRPKHPCATPERACLGADLSTSDAALSSSTTRLRRPGSHDSRTRVTGGMDIGTRLDTPAGEPPRPARP